VRTYKWCAKLFGVVVKLVNRHFDIRRKLWFEMRNSKRLHELFDAYPKGHDMYMSILRATHAIEMAIVYANAAQSRWWCGEIKNHQWKQ